MPIVIDATVTIAWFFQDESSTASEAVLDRLRDNDAIVPPLWQLEVTNALLVAEGRRQVSEHKARLLLLAQLPITITSRRRIPSPSPLARRQPQRLPGQLPRPRPTAHTPLATTDKALAEASRLAGIQLVDVATDVWLLRFRVYQSASVLTGLHRP
jgi:predicted nucleic acid-binding protein